MPHLYSLTLQRSTAITNAIYGNFSAAKSQEVVVSRGKILELLRPDDQGKIQSIYATEIFGIIRTLAPFRLTGANRDYILVGSDSGRIVILEFDTAKNVFNKVHQETYGKSGCRRVIPGQYLAVDPKGRACMIGALERQKFAYILNRDSSNKLTISSPLEAHKDNAICFHQVGLDVGFENPVFACLEVSTEKIDEDPEAEMPKKQLTFYELDLGLNHVIRKYTDTVEDSAHLLIPVPGGLSEGPGGVLVCCENHLCYKKQGHPDVMCAIPRRLEMAQDKGLMIVSCAMHKLREFFFFLIQSEYGDLYKVTLTSEEEIVNEIQIKYFDTIPVTTSICVLKTGFLFAASEFGNHALYQFQGIGVDDEDPICTSSHPHKAQALVAFKPRGLKNLLMFDDLFSLSPICDMKILDAANEGQTQIYTLCGRGPRSTMRVLRHGLGVVEMAVSELPGRPYAVWSVKKLNEAKYHQYIVVSFIDVTLVLSIGDTVEEVLDSGFLATAPSLLIALMADDSHVQVHPTGIRHLLPRRTNEWKVPGGKRIQAAAANDRQVVIALAGGEILYFEIDENHALNEVAKREMNYEIVSLSVQPIPKNRARANFIAVGGVDNSVRILSLDKERPLKQLSAQALSHQPESVCLIEMKSATDREAQGQSSVANDGGFTNLYLNIGLSAGIMIRCVVDSITGTLSDQRSRFLGHKKVKLHKVQVNNNEPALLALSQRPWLSYNFQGRYHCTPMCYDSLEYACSLTSEQCPEGFVAISGNTLRILSIERLGEIFHQQVMPLSYTPRRMAPLPPPSIAPDQLLEAHNQKIHLAVLEADHNAYNEETRQEIRAALKKIQVNNNEEEDLPEEQIGTFKAGEGKWGSCIRIVDPTQLATVCKLNLDIDECAVCATVCYFTQLPKQPCLVVGTAHNMTLKPRKAPRCAIKTYIYDENYQLQLIHSTPTQDVCQCLFPFEGRLLAGVGKSMTIFELGKKKLLKKCEYKNIPEAISWIHVKNDRIYCTDVRESFHVLKYNREENMLFVVCDDVAPRWMMAASVIDYRTMFGSDKFDNIFMARVPEHCANDEQVDTTGMRLKADTAYLTGQTAKLEHIMQFHVGEMVTAVEKTPIALGGADCIIYSTLMGSIGALYPIQTTDEIDFLQHLEMAMRTERAPLCGRDHMGFRSAFFPVQNCIDGDLCEHYSLLSQKEQVSVASSLDKTPAEILKKLEDIRNKIL
ncbi:unnamed protein product [Amoebophrya sp. A120]|nr:unnamed protein product [Amoebophrya sp. A120]|eukprot:GSA120T00022307001.1